jgi:hypothetical protein
MFSLLQVATVMLVALAAALSVAHALELPGKMRLDEDTYFAVQSIYYPGFTIGGGIAEGGGIPAAALLLLLTPAGTTAFWLVLIALLGMLAMHAVYWVFVHPVNRYWVARQPVGALGASFFRFGAKREDCEPDWTELRDRWEYSHLARAVLTSMSLLALVISLVVQP